MQGSSETPREVFMFLSRDVEELLADNETSVDELLRREGLAVETTLARNPGDHEESQAKEPVTVLLATAALVAAVTPTLTRAISAIAHRAVVVEESVLVPVEDSRGEVVRDADGSPVLHWTERSRFLEASPTSPDTTSVSLQGPLGITVDYRESTERQEP